MKIIRPFTVVDGGLTSNVPEADADAHSLTKVYALGETAMQDHRVYESRVGSFRAVTFTGGGAGNINLVAHGFGSGTDRAVRFETTAGLPAEITAGVTYYTRGAGVDFFTVSATPGAVAITFAGTGTGVHTVLDSDNYSANPATNATVWLDTGATNRWSMFDTSVQSQTELAGTIDAEVTLTDRIDTMAFINIDATEVQVIMTSPEDGEVYNETINTNSTEGIIDAYTYFFEPITRRADIVFESIPPYASATVQILVVGPDSGTAKVGGCVLGLGLQVGDTEVGVKVGTQDYSIKQRDAFGNYNIVERAFAKRASFTVTLDSRLVDKFHRMLAVYRATPIVYIGSASYGATIVYGFYKSFDMDIGYIDGTSTATLEVEGLT